MRNGAYTVYKGHHLEFFPVREEVPTKEEEKKYIIVYRGPGCCPFSNFVKGSKGEYFLQVSSLEINKAYCVKTYGLYKGYKFEVFDFKNAREGVVRIGTNDNKAFKKLELFEVDKSWYMKDVPMVEIEELWEERSPIYNLPMPNGLKKIEKIKKQ